MDQRKPKNVFSDGILNDEQTKGIHWMAGNHELKLTAK